MPDDNPTVNDVDAAFKRAFLKALNNNSSPSSLRDLAEAWAWVQSPNQAHGGTAAK